MEKVLVSHEYDLKQKDIDEGTKPQWKALAMEVLMNWAKTLYYYKRKEQNPGAPIPFEFFNSSSVVRELYDLNKFPGSSVCIICEEMLNVSCWELYGKVVEYMKNHTQCQKNKNIMA